MTSGQTIGLVLLAMGAVDASTAFWLPGRIADERTRGIVRLSLLSSGAMIALLGALFLAGAIG